MSIHESSSSERAVAEEASLVGVRLRLNERCSPIVSLLERLSNESLDDLSSELAHMDSAEMAEFVAALDTLDHLATRLQPTMSTECSCAPVGSRGVGASRSSGRTTDFVDVAIDELAAMLIELTSSFESSTEYDATSNTDWCSPDGRCEVSKSGRSAALLWSLQQDPEAVFAEYQIRLDGEEVWSWSDKVWPDLSVDISIRQSVRIPSLCLEAITHHLEQHSAEWVERWREVNAQREQSNHAIA